MATPGYDGRGESVRSGTWPDYSTGLLYAMSNRDANILKALIAVWLGLSSPYVFRLLKYLLFLVMTFIESRDAPQTREERAPLNQNGAAAASRHAVPLRWQKASEVLSQSTGGRDLFARTCKYAYTLKNPHKAALVLLGFLPLVSFVARAAIGVLSAFVATDTAALWAADKCGLFVFDSEGAGDGAAARADVYDREKESRAGAYAKYCYNLSTSPQPLHCNFFHRQRIAFTTTYDYECPFPRQDICARGAQAVTFDSGNVDASFLGINDPYGYKFRRTTTCVPLSTESPYVRNETANGTAAFSYMYGERIGRKDTFHSTGDPFNWLAATYDINVQSTTLQDADEAYWTPIPALTPPSDNILTVMFINPLHILYLKASADPIFVADHAFYYPDDPVPTYYKNDAMYRVLACLDTRVICLPNNGPCRPLVGNSDDTDEDFPPEYWLLKWSLDHSDMYYSIAKRLGTALVAQDMISQYTSVPLGDRHWALEAERLFATSLARAQFDAWSLGSGEDAARLGSADGYRDETPAGVGSLCGLVKFRSTGYTNISVMRFWLLMAVTPLLWLLSLEVRIFVRAWGWIKGGASDGAPEEEDGEQNGDAEGQRRQDGEQASSRPEDHLAQNVSGREEEDKVETPLLYWLLYGLLYWVPCLVFWSIKRAWRSAGSCCRSS